MSFTPYLPQWAVKMIEAIGADVGDISISQQTHSHKKQVSVSLMSYIFYNCDPKSYVDA